VRLAILQLATTSCPPGTSAQTDLMQDAEAFDLQPSAATLCSFQVRHNLKTISEPLQMSQLLVESEHLDSSLSSPNPPVPATEVINYSATAVISLPNRESTKTNICSISREFQN